MKEFRNKKVLIFGLGSLGGGVASVKWFYKKGAKLRITDLKNKKDLEKSLKKLKNIKAKYILGKHRKEDFDWAEMIVVNPGVSYKNDFVKYALSKNKLIENDCSLFFQYAQGEFIAVTGTRGKTTTTTWIYELLKAFTKEIKKKLILGGNQPDKSLLKIIEKTNKNTLSVLEISSFQLEFYRENLKAPQIAVITNIYNDHLNRYENIYEYALTKAKIFQNQKEKDCLILNYDNEFTKFFLKQKPKSQVYFVSLKNLPKKLKGAFIKNNFLILRDQKEEKILNIKKFKKIYGEHNVYNFLFALLTLYLYLKSKNLKLDLQKIKKKIYSLKTPEFRQQVVYQSKNLLIINDSAGTSPDAVIAALKRFKNKNLILITGGTDKNLDFKELAQEIKNNIKKENLIFLNGSATQKLLQELEKLNYQFLKENIFENLKDCFKKALEINLKKKMILFSPGSASFEKFKNEFDRGKKFNKLISILC